MMSKGLILKLPFIVILNQWQTLYSGFRVPILGEIYSKLSDCSNNY